MQHEEHDVLQLIAEGRLPELSLDVLPDEISGLHEDMLNFEIGHVCEACDLCVMCETTGLQASVDNTLAQLDANLATARALIAQSRFLVAQSKMQAEARLH